MSSELTPISEESLRFVHRHPVVVAALETVGAVAIVIALEALGVLAHSPAKELIDSAVAAVITFPITASFNLKRAAEAKKRLFAPWSSSDGAA
jgi:hypothetical protein